MGEREMITLSENQVMEIEIKWRNEINEEKKKSFVAGMYFGALLVSVGVLVCSFAGTLI